MFNKFGDFMKKISYETVENANKPRRLHKVCNAYIAKKLAIRKIFKYCTTTAIAFTVFSGCNENATKPIPEPENNSLVGGYWKLVGYYDIEKDTLVKPLINCDNVASYPHIAYILGDSCEFLYHIRFSEETYIDNPGTPAEEERTVSRAIGRMVVNRFGGKHSIDYLNSTISLKDVGYNTLGMDHYDGENFLDALHRVYSFELKNNELKLFANACPYCRQWYDNTGKVCNTTHHKPIYLQFRRVEDE